MVSAKLLAATYDLMRVQAAQERQATTPTPPAVATSAPTVDAGGVDTALRLDTELGRVAIGLKQAPQFRVWVILQEHARQTGRQYISRTDLRKLLDAYDIRYTIRTFNRWLWVGRAIYWNLDGGRIWLIGYRRLAIRLIDMVQRIPKARRGRDIQNLILTNHPGYFRFMYVDISGASLDTFEARIYSAWLAAKDNPRLSRYTLSLLFNRDAKTLRKWDRLAGITIIHGFIHYTGETSHHIPESADGGHRGDVLEYTVNGRKRWSAEYSNTYVTPPTRQHDKRGQALSVSRIMHRLLSSVQAAGSTAQIPYRDGRLHRTGRKVYHDAKRARKAINPKAPQPLYILKGFDNRRGVHFECTLDGYERTRLKACSAASRVLEIKPLV